MIEKKTTKEILHDITLSIVGNNGKYDFVNYEYFKNKQWVSVESILKLSPDELIDEIRNLHIQKDKELKDD